MKKMISSILVSVFFLFFWIHGPINQEIVHTGENLNLSDTFVSKLVGQGGEQRHSGILTKRETSVSDGSETHGLLLNASRRISGSGIIGARLTDEEKDIQNHELIRRASEATNLREEEITLKGNYAIGKSTVYFESGPGYDHISGYAGPIHVGLILSLDNDVEKLVIISSDETESYLRKIQRSGYYQQYQNLSFDQGKKKIDGVSGATVTSQAVGLISNAMIEDITDNLPSHASMGSYVFSLKVENSLIWIAHVSVIVALFVYGFQKRIKKSRKHILILGLLSIIYIGFFLNNSFTYVSFMGPFIGANISSFTGIYAFATLIAAIWGNNTYCKYVCPFGHVQRIFIRVPFIKQRKLPLSNLWLERLRNALTMTLIAGILLGFRNWKNYEIFPSFFGGNILSVGFIIALFIILISAVYPMFWCRVACPTGCVLDTINKINK
jgi:NosR/NirI family nitrous oxide reductase transcriptional regulator